MPSIYQEPTSSYATTIVTQNRTRRVAPTGAEATVRVSGSTTPATNYLTITARAEHEQIGEDRGAILHGQANDFKVSLSRSSSGARSTYTIRGNPDGNTNYVTIRPGATSAEVGTHANDWQVTIVGGAKEEYASFDGQLLYMELVTTGALNQRSTLNSIKALVEGLTEQDFTATVSGSGTTRPQATISVDRGGFSAGRDRIPARVEWNEETETIEIVAPASETLTSLAADVNALDGFTAVVSGAGATTLEAVFADRSFAGGEDETAQEVIVSVDGKYLAWIATSAPANDNGAMFRIGDGVDRFYLPPKHGLYLKRGGANNADGSVDVYPANLDGPDVTFHQGAAVRE